MTGADAHSVRATILTVMPSPYIQDLFAALAERVRLRVLYLETEAPDTHWGQVETPDYAEVLRGNWWGLGGVRLHWNPDVRRRLQDTPTDVYVVGGYMGITQQSAMRWLNKRSRPWVFWGEVPGMRKRGPLGSWLRSIAMGPIRGAAGIAAIGRSAADSYGRFAPDAAMEVLPYFCRLDEFRAARREQAWDGGRPLRVLYCGQLIERKGVDVLLSAVESLARQGAPIQWKFVGEGPLRSELQRRADDAGASAEFTGFLEVDQLPAHFGESDVFVLPSRHDGWGVVVNQALGAGLPVVATHAVGAARDLIRDNENGWLVEPQDAEALRRVFSEYAQSPETVAAHRRAAIDTAEQIDLEAGADRWAAFLARIRDQHHRSQARE